MAKKFKVYDTESGRVVSIIERVADAVKLAAGATTNGSASVTVTSTAGLWPGMLLIGKGIPSGTKVLSIDSATAFTMDDDATADGDGLTIIALSYIPYKADGTLEVREVHLEHYRDLFNDDTAVQLIVGGGANGGALSSPGAVVYPTEVVFGAFGGGTTGNASITATAEVGISDHLTHTAPREQTQKCSFVHFILDDGTLLPVLRLPAYDIVPVASSS